MIEMKIHYKNIFCQLIEMKIIYTKYIFCQLIEMKIYFKKYILPNDRNENR